MTNEQSRRELIYFVLLMVFLLPGIAEAQEDKAQSPLKIEDIFRPQMPSQLDTIYYPFYNGVQMIEVDHIGFWDRKIFFLEQSQPRAMPHSMFHPMPVGNEYFFRDTTGTIVKAFNTKYDLSTLTKRFREIPIQQRTQGFRNLFPYHSSQDYKGVWYQSPQVLFDFSGFYKVSTTYAEQASTQYTDTDFGQVKEVKYGLIDSLGNLVVPMEYDAIIPYHTYLLVQKNQQWGIITYGNKIVVPIIFDNYKFDAYSLSIDPEKTLPVYFLSSKDPKNKPNDFTYAAIFLPQKNELLTLNHYDEIYRRNSRRLDADSNRAVFYVTKNNKKGLLSEDFQEIIPPLYDVLDMQHKKGLFRVAREGKFGFWNHDYETIIPLEYDYVEDFSADSTALVLKNGEFYRIDVDNEKQDAGNLQPDWIIEPLHFRFNPNYCSVRNVDLRGIIDTTSNRMILPMMYYQSLNPSQVSRFYDKHQSELEAKELSMATPFDMTDELLFHQNKLILQHSNGKFGVMDTSLRVLIDFKYDKLEAISANLGYLLYSRNGKTGAMDYFGKELLTEKYEELRYDNHNEQERDIFKVKRKGKWGVVNFENEILLPCEYDSIKFLGHWNRPKEKLWVVGKNERFGVVDKDNQIFVPFEYHWISHLESNNLWVHDKDNRRYKVVLRK